MHQQPHVGSASHPHSHYHRTVIINNRATVQAHETGCVAAVLHNQYRCISFTYNVFTHTLKPFFLFLSGQCGVRKENSQNKLLATVFTDTVLAFLRKATVVFASGHAAGFVSLGSIYSPVLASLGQDLFFSLLQLSTSPF